MSDDWFEAWVELHCTATGAGPGARATILANRENFVARWNATPAELGECTARLVGSMRTPKFPNEHADAVGLELVRLREERAAADRVAPAGDFAPDCPACGGSGLAVIPVRACVWDGRLVLHPEQRRVATGAVLCDRPGCEAGRVACDREDRAPGDRPRRPRLSACERRAGCDLVGLLRAHERDQAGRARRVVGPGGNFPAMAAILGRVAA